MLKQLGALASTGLGNERRLVIVLEDKFHLLLCSKQARQ
jgi:hypothetical protein